jgi:hypothetical protein
MNKALENQANALTNGPYPGGVFIHGSDYAKMNSCGAKEPSVATAREARNKAGNEQMIQRAKGAVDMLLEQVNKAASIGEMMVKVMVEKERASGEIDTAGILIVERTMILKELINRGFQATIFQHQDRVEVNIYW